MFRNTTIFVIEDAEAIRSMICEMLAQQGYQCIEAADGVDTLRLLDENAASVHLVLTDVIMPKMTGAELGSRLMRLRPDLPILFMSGYSHDPVVRNFENVPAKFLPQLFTAEALLEKVRQALSHSRNGLSEVASSASASDEG